MHNGFLIALLTKVCMWVKHIGLQLHTKTTETAMTIPYDIMILQPHKTVLMKSPRSKQLENKNPCTGYLPQPTV